MMDMQFRVLGASESGQYREMTFPAYRRLLDFQPAPLHPNEMDSRKIWPLAVGVLQDGAPMGMVLGGLPMEKGGIPHLLSLFVARSARRRGLGAALVDQFETAVLERGFDAVQTVYMTGRTGAAIFEHLLEERNWSPPKARMLVVRFTIAEAMGTPWFGKYKLRSGSTVFDWKDLKDDDLAQLKASQEREPWIPDDLVPWRFDQDTLESRSSVGLRLDDEIVGWVLNHAVTAETVRFTCSFVRRDLARRGRILPLYTESIRRLADGPFAWCSFTVPAQHPEMVAFAEKWCVPWTSSEAVESRSAVKLLNNESNDEVKHAHD